MEFAGDDVEPVIPYFCSAAVVVGDFGLGGPTRGTFPRESGQGDGVAPGVADR